MTYSHHFDWKISRYLPRNATEVSITLESLDAGGYLRNGGDYRGHPGPGLKIYRLDWESPELDWRGVEKSGWFEVSAPDRKTLRGYLRTNYPNAKIGR